MEKGDDEDAGGGLGEAGGGGDEVEWFVEEVGMVEKTKDLNEPLGDKEQCRQ